MPVISRKSGKSTDLRFIHTMQKSHYADISMLCKPHKWEMELTTAIDYMYNGFLYQNNN